MPRGGWQLKSNILSYYNKLLKRSEKMTAINTAEEIELVYLWQDPATSRMFFTTHMVPN